ncbi:hypothetical protein QBE55_01515 [Eubacteriales bacterium mix99]|jgi:hypothetical protein|nr:hypothetical protein [Clostridiales bacterium]
MKHPVRHPRNKTRNEAIREKVKPLVSVLILAVMLVSLYVSSYIPFDRYVSKQIATFNAIGTGRGTNGTNAIPSEEGKGKAIGTGKVINTGSSKANQAVRTDDTDKAGTKGDHYGYLQPQVVDGFSEEPIQGATVVIPEINQKFVTAEDGYTAAIRIPIQEDAHFEKIEPKPWSEVTILVYCPDYIEYALFQAHVWESQSRKGPKILLFPKEKGKENEPFGVVEGPHRIWIKELVEKYRPKK